MSTDLDPTQLAIEFLRRDKTELSPAQYLKRLKHSGVRVCRSPHPLCNRTERRDLFRLAVGSALIKSV